MHSDFDYVLPDGESSRLTDILNVIDRVGVVAERGGARSVVFGGDLFHTPRAVQTGVYVKTFKRLKALAAKIDNLVLNSGNHDIPSLRVGLPVAAGYPFSAVENLHVAAGAPEAYRLLPTGGTQYGVRVHAVPYAESLEPLMRYVREVSVDKNYRNLLVTHCGLEGAACGPNEVKLPGGAALNELCLEKFDFVFAGHYHHPQRLAGGKVVVIGSPLQMNMLDRGDKRGVIIYDSEANSYKRVWLPGPEFHMLDVAGADDLDNLRGMENLVGGYVRATVTDRTLALDVVREVLTGLGVRRFDVRRGRVASVAPRDAEITLKASRGGLAEAVKPYVEKMAPKELKKKRLIAVGEEILSAVRNE